MCLSLARKFLTFTDVCFVGFVNEFLLSVLRKKDSFHANSNYVCCAHTNLDAEHKQKRNSVGKAVTGEIWSCCLGLIETCLMFA